MVRYGAKKNSCIIRLRLFVISYPEQRTIVRQGERATSFYIILSGSAIPTYKRATDGNIETLDVLNRGCTFGVRDALFFSKFSI